MLARKLLQTIGSAVLLGGAVYAFGSTRVRRPPSEALAAPTSAPEVVSPLEVDGTRIKVRKADGGFASNDELVGAVLVGRVDGGIRNAIRIDAIEADAADPSGEVLLYSFSVQDPATGAWKNACAPDAR